MAGAPARTRDWKISPISTITMSGASDPSRKRDARAVRLRVQIDAEC